MSGHSKWATTHRQKEANDSKKGVAFTKLSQAITVAVRQGGGLRLAIDRARALNMPKENVNRAIEKGMGHGEGTNLTELTLEGFLPAGVAVLVDILTDNKLRTAQQVRDIVDKSGGSMAGLGAVSYLFKQEGEINAKSPLMANAKSTDEQELEIIDFGINDLVKSDEGWIIYCEKDRLFELRNELEKMGYTVTHADLIMHAEAKVVVESKETRTKIEEILSRLDDLDDVTHVWTNYA